MLSFAHPDACRVRIAWAFLVRGCRELLCLRPSIQTSGSLATAMPARATAETRTHPFNRRGFSWPGAIYHSRSVTPSRSGCGGWAIARHRSTTPENPKPQSSARHPSAAEGQENALVRAEQRLAIFFFFFCSQFFHSEQAGSGLFRPAEVGSISKYLTSAA